MAKFKVGDRVRWGKEPPDEIIEDIDNKGYIEVVIWMGICLCVTNHRTNIL